MYFRDTGFVPNDPANRGYLHNPEGTLPYPRPKDTTIGFYDGGEVALQLFTTAAPNWREASYTTPLFDLRPDLRSMTGCNQEGVAIWKYAGSGKGGRLHIVIAGLDQFAGTTKNLKVTTTELVSPNRPQQLFQVTDCENISDQFVKNDRPATYIAFEPTGEYPIRFWQIKIDFLWREALASLPQFRIYAAYY